MPFVFSAAPDSEQVAVRTYDGAYLGRVTTVGSAIVTSGRRRWQFRMTGLIAQPYRLHYAAKRLIGTWAMQAQMMNVEIVRIDHAQCLPLRQQVLWPDFPLEHSYVPGDEQAEHYAVTFGNQLLCCLSVFALGEGLYQIRKFATAAEFQGQGLGSALLSHVISETQKADATAITLSARETATGFYEKFGFSVSAERFERHGVRYVSMLLELSNNAD